jgi:hypothetical protein
MNLFLGFQFNDCTVKDLMPLIFRQSANGQVRLEPAVEEPTVTDFNLAHLVTMNRFASK